MSLDTGASLHFNPGSALGFDIHHSDHEEDEVAEDEKKRQKELEDLLTKTTAFDDLIEDECETSIDVSDMEDSRMLFRRSNTDQTQKDIAKKKTETSTPLHEVPEWNINYTPIERPQNLGPLPYHLENQNGSGNVSFENASFNETHTAMGAFHQQTDGHLSQHRFDKETGVKSANGHGTLMHRPHGDSEVLREKLNFFSAGDVTTVPDEPDRQDSGYNRNPESILELKEQLLQQRQESQEVIRSLKDELTLLKGEKERVAFSLQQARELLISKNEEVQTAHLRAEELAQDLHSERNKNLQLSEKVQAVESLATTLQAQVYDLSSFKGHAKRVEAQENLIKNMQQAHSAEVEKLNGELDRKVQDLEILQKRLHQLELYQEQTLPSKMHGIDKLTNNLETVQNYCLQILSSDAFQDVDVLRIHQLEDERKRNQQKHEIESLMATIISLNQKLQEVSDQESVPLSAHRTALKQLEEEKTDFEKRLQITLEEFSALKKAKELFQDENKKLQGTMKAMIMKHDMDIKSAIDKYHSIQREETKLLQAELRETAEREKDQMRDFYEEKIALLCQDAERLQNLLHETKELYLKVCDEKNVLENAIQGMRHTNPINTVPVEEVKELRQNLEKKYEEDLKKAQEVWNALKRKDIDEAVRECQTSADELEAEVEELKRQLSEKETVIKDMKAVEEKNVQSVQAYYTSLWTDRQKEMQKMYQNKLNSIEQVHKDEFANAIEEMKKTMQEERNEIIKKHREILLKVKKEYDTQQVKVTQLEELHKKAEQTVKELEKVQQNLKDQLVGAQKERRKQSELAEECKRRLQEDSQNRTQSLMEKLSLLNKEVEVLRKDKELLVQRTTEYEVFVKTEAESKKNGRSMGSQTEKNVVPKEEVLELQKLCLELLIQMKEELQGAFYGCSQRAADHLKNAVFELQNNR